MKILNALLVTALFAAGAAAQEPQKTAAENAWKTRVFTAGELQKFNGKDGMPAYGAVDGIVYDLSRSKYWKAGRHMKMHEAGTDLSSAIHNKAPKLIHKDGKILEKMPKVGVMEGYDKEKLAAPPPDVKKPAVESKTGPASQPEEKATLAALHKVTREEVGFETSCPVTGQKVKVSEKTPAVDFKGKTYYFSGLDSMKKFSKDPAKTLAEKAKGLFKKKKS